MSVCTPKSFDLTGKVALVTGASYGIGFAIATAMANCGAKIVFKDVYKRQPSPSGQSPCADRQRH